MSRAGGADWTLTLTPPDDTRALLTRRHLLTSGAAAAMVIALPSGLAYASAALDPAYLRRASYAGLVGQTFTVSWWGGSARLTLDAVEDLAGKGLAGRDDAFALVFSADPSASLDRQDGPVTLSHPKLGSFQLFLPPVDRAASRQDYEAIVNRSVGARRRQLPPAPPKHPKPAHHRHRDGFVRRVHAERVKHGVRCSVELSDRLHARRAHGWLMRDGDVVAAAKPHAVHHHHTVLRLVAKGRLPRGDYDLVVATAHEKVARVPLTL